MAKYDYNEIKSRITPIELADRLGAKVVKGRCNAAWRNGDNPGSVAVDNERWFDHVAEVGGGVIELGAVAWFGNTSQSAIDGAQERLGEMLNLIPIDAEGRPDRKEQPQGNRYTNYDYVDEKGDLVFKVQRVDMPNGSKRFVQMDADGSPGVKHIEKLPIYNLPAVVKAETVFVCEGEKAADAVIAVGLTATTNAGGAKNWKPHYSEWLRDKNVVILTDNDEPGREHGDKVAAECLAVGASVKVVCLSEIEKGDAYDYLTSEGGTRESLIQRVIEAPFVTGVNVELRDATAIESRDIPPPDQVVQDLADRGDKLFIIGSSKARKSFFTLQLAAHMASGGRAGLEFMVDSPKRVLYLNLEIQGNHFERRFQRMIKACGMQGAILAGTLNIAHRRGNPLSDAEIIATAKSVRADVIIIDPAYKMMGWDEKDLTPMLAMFDRIVNETNSLLIIVHHEKKGMAGDRQGVDRGSGDGKMARDYDAAILLAMQRDEPDAVVITQIQRNYPPCDRFCLMFENGAFHPTDLPPVEATSQSMKKSASGAKEPDYAVIERMVRDHGPYSKTEFIEVLREAGCTDRGAKAYAERIVRLKGFDVNQTREKRPGGRIMFHTSAQRINQ